MVDEHDGQRNFQEGWCPAGITLSQALSAADPVFIAEITDEFAGKPDEGHAALLLYAFTGFKPRLEDKQSKSQLNRSGAVDIVLEPPFGRLQVVEVTRSLDPRYQQAAAANKRFESEIAREYRGDITWMLELERGWERWKLKQLAPLVAQALNAACDSGITGEEPVIVQGVVHAHPVGSSSPPIVFVGGRNAGASSNGKPYLDALTDYLATDSTIRSKLEKLERDQSKFEAYRCHLFIGMASTGARGGLLPDSPSNFTWGTFVAPSPLTDIWLDGGTGELYHWTAEEGWVFHNTSTA
jgi:hypothetical protein